MLNECEAKRRGRGDWARRWLVGFGQAMKATLYGFRF